MEWIFLYSVFLMFSVENVISLPLGVCGESKSIAHSNANKSVLVTFCCNYFHKKNGVCVACPFGYESTGENCTPCVNGLYGKKCAEQCRCNTSERCNHVKGCIAIDDKTETKEKTPRPEGLSNSQDASNGHNDVVTYMTCVAVGSVLVVVFGLLVKNREAICRRSGNMTAMKNEIMKRKQSFGPGKSCGKDKKESLYAEINEKYMINFDGE